MPPSPSIADPSALLEVRELSIQFARAPRPAVSGLSFRIAPGESLGLVGESGSGKSVTALAILRLLQPGAATLTGHLHWKGEDLLTLGDESMRSLRGREIAMIFQEPMTALNPVMPVGAQIAEALTAHQPRMARAEVRERVHEAMHTVALPDPARRAKDYPHQFSGGQRQRILIAMAIINRPRLLIADEPTTALDVTVQAQILALLAKLRDDYGLAMLFISHDLAVVSQVADRVAVMRHGLLLEQAATVELFRNPQHPYTRSLLRAAPTMTTPLHEPLATLDGDASWREGALVECGPNHWVRSAQANHPGASAL